MELGFTRHKGAERGGFVCLIGRLVWVRVKEVWGLSFWFWFFPGWAFVVLWCWYLCYYNQQRGFILFAKI